MNQEIASLKQKIYHHCSAIITTKIDALRASLKGYQDAANEETKSSAGDKYETGRAMMHLEKEKVAHSLNEALKQKKVIDQIDPERTTQKIDLGSLVKTNKGLFYISVSLGQITVDGKLVFCISPVSPIGQIMIKSITGSTITFNKTSYAISEVC